MFCRLVIVSLLGLLDALRRRRCVAWGPSYRRARVLPPHSAAAYTFLTQPGFLFPAFCPKEPLRERNADLGASRLSLEGREAPAEPVQKTQKTVDIHGTKDEVTRGRKDVQTARDVSATPEAPPVERRVSSRRVQFPFVGPGSVSLTFM